MFEKEAEDKAFEKYPLSDRCDRIDLERNLKYEEGFQDGAQFGYKKGNEWHYVKDIKPKDNEYVLIYTDIKNVYIARLVEDDYFITNKGGFVQTSAVIAWKEIVLPKESE